MSDTKTPTSISTRGRRARWSGRLLLHAGWIALLALFTASCTERVDVPAPASGVPDIRVLLFDDQASVEVSIAGPFRIMLVGESEEPREILAGDGLDTQVARCVGGDLIFGDIVRTPAGVSIEPKGVAFHVDGRPYSGRLLLTAYRGAVRAINTVDLESYVKGVVPVESYPGWPAEALKAQAVAARSYAVAKMELRETWSYDVSDTTSDQRYDGIGKETAGTNAAVEATAGEVIYYGGEPLCAYFHSCCGGRTADPRLELNDATSRLRGAKCGYCTKSPRYRWKASAKLPDVADALSVLDLTGLTPENIGLDGRVGRVVLHRSGGRPSAVTGPEFRRDLNRKGIKLLSTRFEVSASGGEFVFTGQGFGHGVGMCQWGSKGMADDGQSYKDILGRYYRDCKLRQRY
jgi:stage II sporulation protein D (peptidoglycan lytic transglycosylase)